MKRTNLTTIVLLQTLTFFSFLSATTIHVPADSLTIQGGLNGATEGDTVLVASGTYYENIIWPATNGIKLIGSGEEDCIIDGDSLGSVIRFEEDLGGIIDSTTLIFGFSLQRGRSRGGGGIYCGNSSPTISHVTVSGNMVVPDYGDAGAGGGILLYNSSPILENVIISGNTVSRAPRFRVGGGIFCDSSNPILNGVKIINNKSGHGGGIYCSNSTTLLESSIFTNCHI